MKVIGIDIDKTKAIFYALQMDDDGKITNLTGDQSSFTLKDDTNNKAIRTFQSTLHAYFDKIKADRIAVLKRQTKGRFRSAPLSFKIEGLIQCYKKVDIEFVQPMSVTGYFKKNEFTLEPEFDHQEDAAKLSLYLLKTTPIHQL